MQAHCYVVCQNELSYGTYIKDQIVITLLLHTYVE